MRRLRRAAWVLAAASLFVGLFLLSARAASETRQALKKERARLEEMKRKAEKAAAELAEAIEKEKMTRERMEELKGKLARKKRLLAGLDRRLAELARRLDQAEQDVRRLDAEREGSARRMGGAAARIFTRERDPAELFSRGGGERERLRRFARIVLASEAARYGSLSFAVGRREAEKEGLARSLKTSERVRERELSLGRALASRTEAEARRLAEIDRQKKRKEKELRALRAKIAAMEALVTRIERKMARRERRAEKPQGETPARFASLGGGLVPPVVGGRVVGRFGKQKDPVFDVEIDSRGIEIEAPSKAVIRAVGKGEVVFSGSVNGFGRVLILQHGSGLFSVYGKAEAFAVKQGQQVATGEPVGRLPESPTGKSVLYLELRAGGTAVDPMSVIPIPRG